MVWDRCSNYVLTGNVVERRKNVAKPSNAYIISVFVEPASEESPDLYCCYVSGDPEEQKQTIANRDKTPHFDTLRITTIHSTNVAQYQNECRTFVGTPSKKTKQLSIEVLSCFAAALRLRSGSFRSNDCQSQAPERPIALSTSLIQW